MKKAVILTLAMILLALPYLVNATPTCRTIGLGNLNFTISISGQGFGKIVDGSEFLAFWATSVKNYTASGTQIGDIFAISNEGGCGITGNHTSMWYCSGDVSAIREYDYAHNLKTTINGANLGGVSPSYIDLELTPNASQLYMINFLAEDGRRGTLRYYDIKTGGSVKTLWNTTNTGVSHLGMYIDGQRVYVDNETHIDQYDLNTGQLICSQQYAPNLISPTTDIGWGGYLTGNASNLYMVLKDTSGKVVEFTLDFVPDTTPVEINPDSYNMTSEGGAGCDNWRDDKNNPCFTGDTTPTVSFTTNESAWCAIGIQNINFTNYTSLGVDRNCTIGQGTSSHTCTLTPQDEITEETSYLYIGCMDTQGNENRTSTSGALNLSIHTSDLESRGRYGIETGIQSALSSGYTIYTNQKVYARNSANVQSAGTFDKVVKWLNKVWAFNFLTGNDTYVNMFNISPVLYTLEMRNITNSTVNTTVYNFIMSTK